MTARPLSPQEGLAHARPNYIYIYIGLHIHSVFLQQYSENTCRVIIRQAHRLPDVETALFPTGRPVVVKPSSHVAHETKNRPELGHPLSKRSLGNAPFLRALFFLAEKGTVWVRVSN